MFDVNIKKDNMKTLEAYRAGLMIKPQLRHLFLELTLRCNEKCLHCGSSCGDVQMDELNVNQYAKFLAEVKGDFGTANKDFFDIMAVAHELGFHWGMTSNATLIDYPVAKDLKRVGMGTISVSIDGLEETHDVFRRTPGGWKRALNGVESLIRTEGFKHIQITTVVTHQNISQLNELYKIFDDMDIDSWRIINIEPIGRAKQHPELILTDDDYRYMFEYIRNKRIAGEPVTYGCSHYLGMEYEREVRDWYYICTAGTYIASIMANGDITACLDIERRPEFVQGNILTDRFKDVWENRFEIFRKNLSDENEKCRNCAEKCRCHGDSYHSWDFDKHEPQLCFKDILF